MKELPKTETREIPEGYELATLGAGCFWCVEAIFEKLKGVKNLLPGFSGGHIEDPSYQDVVTGTTGHAEVIQFAYDPQILPFSEILKIFWSTHNPTTLNRQGADVGAQYRSAIFYHSDKQKEIAEELKKQLNNSDVFSDPIVTEITPFSNFYPAEDYHKQYYETNKQAPYCQMVIRPKVEKFKQYFGERIK
ncbi:peptide-methionine (S)-S-oxide reductase MsrA [Echinicola jeungdonensis]|uniref:Peptide methionine sulfoxide reductase MsrA n=1 Tax=Echinicola jeungdonensis TaxID=709343 RepID=A0ABV5J5B1_9BACT|nr:peptide-methionine (S)-S-oxide reductase MsrA [Echinicola jeungdonensis]MDN3670833.1 peptide-methionine (S)-S-oxide reductase MsrA [Echinicola jeungdonensis]